METTEFNWLPVIFDSAKALLAFGAALVITSGIRVNRGAKVNRAWLLIAAGVFVIGVAMANRAVSMLDLPNIAAWGDAMTVVGLALVVVGLVEWRRLLSELTK